MRSRLLGKKVALIFCLFTAFLLVGSSGAAKEKVAKEKKVGAGYMVISYLPEDIPRMWIA